MLFRINVWHCRPRRGADPGEGAYSEVPRRAQRPAGRSQLQQRRRHPEHQSALRLFHQSVVYFI